MIRCHALATALSNDYLMRGEVVVIGNGPTQIECTFLLSAIRLCENMSPIPICASAGVLRKPSDWIKMIMNKLVMMGAEKFRCAKDSAQPQESNAERQPLQRGSRSYFSFCVSISA